MYRGGGRGGFRGGRGGAAGGGPPMGDIPFKELEQMKTRTELYPKIESKTSFALNRPRPQERRNVRRQLELIRRTRFGPYWTPATPASAAKDAPGSSSLGGGDGKVETLRDVKLQKHVFPQMILRSYMQMEERREAQIKKKRKKLDMEKYDWSKFERQGGGGDNDDAGDLSAEEDQGEYEDELDDDYNQNYFDNGEDERDDLGDDMGGGDDGTYE